MINVDLPDVSFVEKREQEQRRCPTCHYIISNPLTDRCPRCFSSVERVETNCGDCMYQGNCEIAHLTHASKNNVGS